MAIQRIDEIAEPIVGKFYLVPTVRAEWFGKTFDWPVLGPMHRDRECFKFEDMHYHFDARFMPSVRGDARDQYWHWQRVIGAPLTTNVLLNSDGFPAQSWKKLKCKRLVNPILHSLRSRLMSEERGHGFRCLSDAWAGKQAKHDGRGWVCPHRSVPLAGQPVIDGVITCPAHLLRIDTETGLVLPWDRGGANGQPHS